MTDILAGFALLASALLIVVGVFGAIAGAVVFTISEGRRSASAAGAAAFFGGLAAFIAGASIALEIVR